MAMQEVVCTGCGAINQLVARACWRCLESLSDPAATGTVAEPLPPLPDPRPATA